MSSINLIPVDRNFSIDEKQLRSFLKFLAIDEIYIVSGESGSPLELVPGCGGFLLQTPEDVFFESNVEIDKAIELWLNGGALSTGFIVGCDGEFLKSWANSIKQISGEIAGDFYPWDASITLGQWQTIDSDDEKTVVDQGNFKINKSDREYVLKPEPYLKTFLNLPETKALTEWISKEFTEEFQWSID